MSFNDVIYSKQNQYHLPHKRLSKKTKQNRLYKERTLTALYQIAYVFILSISMSSAIVYVGMTYNFYQLPSIESVSDFVYGFMDMRRTEVFHNDLTFEKFNNDFLNKQVVSFKSSLNSSMRLEIQRLLIDEYGEIAVPVGHSASQTLGSQQPLYHMKLRDYIKDHKFSIKRPHYVFDNQLLDKLPKIKSIIREHQPALPEGINNYKEIFNDFNAPPLLTVGTNGSGLAFHQHRRSWNDLFMGEKLWSVYPPYNLPPSGFNPW